MARRIASLILAYRTLSINLAIPTIYNNSKRSILYLLYYLLIECDSSDYVNAGVLSQHDDNGVLRPVAFFSRRLSSAECNYEVYDKELLAIIRSFEEWRPELQGSAYPIKVITDHKNLEYFSTTKLLSRRQARWSEFLSRFDFKITYRRGKLGAKPDALTRRSGDLPKEGDVGLEYQHQVVLKPHNFELHNNNVPRVTEASQPEPEIAVETDPDDEKSLEELITIGYENDPLPNKVLVLLRNGIRHSRDITLAECEDRNGRLYYKERLYVPDWHELKMRLCKNYQDSPVACHPGRSKTFSLLARDYYWPRYHQFVARYVQYVHEASPPIMLSMDSSSHYQYRSNDGKIYPWNSFLAYLKETTRTLCSALFADSLK